MNYKLSDLHTPVPATQPAWIHIVDAYDLKDDETGTITKEWQDAVFPVLAYAALPEGFGAYLVAFDGDGPCWCYRRSPWDEKKSQHHHP